MKSSDKAKSTDDVNDINKHIKTRINQTTQTILIPNLFALLTSISAYIIIGLTSPFNSISVYCSFICRLKR